MSTQGVLKRIALETKGLATAAITALFFFFFCLGERREMRHAP